MNNSNGVRADGRERDSHCNEIECTCIKRGMGKQYVKVIIMCVFEHASKNIIKD